MKAETKKFLSGFIFILLLIPWSLIQQEFKLGVQQSLLFFQEFLFLSYLLNWKKLANWGFYLFFFMILYVNAFVWIDEFVSFLNPDRGRIEINGQMKRVMDMAWIWGALLGFVIAWFLTKRYGCSKSRNQSLEFVIIGFSFLISLMLYFG